MALSPSKFPAGSQTALLEAIRDGILSMDNGDGSSPIDFAAPITTTGIITAINNNPAGVAPAGSAVEIEATRLAHLGIQVTGTYTGSLVLQGTINGTVWTTLAGPLLYSANSGSVGSSIASASQGLFTAAINAYSKVRLTALGAVTGAANISMIAVENTNLIALSSPLPAGSNLIGLTHLAPQTNAGGYGSFHNLVSAATTNLTVVKNGVGNLGILLLANTSTSWKYFKLYAKATAPTLASDTPIMTIPIPPNSTREIIFPMGVRPSTGIAYAITGAAANTDTTAVAAGDVIVSMAYA